MVLYTRESCGFCTPCRDGLPYLKYVIEEIEEGRGEPSDLDLIQDLCAKIYPSTFCALAPGALMPVQSGFDCFKDVFEQHVREKRCPYREKT